MYYYVTLTNNCNQKCRYCYGKACEDFGSDFHGLEVDYSLPSSIAYDTETLRKFLREDPEPGIVFYGGEPLLQMNTLREIMNQSRACRFIIQTNGLLLGNLESDYVNKFETILVSVDGDEALTDHYRGSGTYRIVAENLQRIRENGFRGEIVARMTVGEETEIDRQVLWLIQSNDLPVSSVHWQLDALFWQNDFPKRRFAEWTKDSYNPRLRSLVHAWVEHMSENGQVLRLYPLVGVMQSLLMGERSLLRCGAGWIMFNIQTDGNITPCPVMAGMKDFYLGNIRDTSPERLRDAVFVSEPCTGCEIYQTCGGRCLYANATKLWGDQGFSLVCDTVKNMVDALREALPEVMRLIDGGRIRREDFQYPKYNSCEIIP
ncbi:MAG TPA: TIGR04084 family radical SAM/SPASM domain-containing protein [Candidatus Acidoferrum sp.]|nr:TIGR04084 family radical SAM/SPASM domain-containing protein [Candidatus Acidoferrum sp.]